MGPFFLHDLKQANCFACVREAKSAAKFLFEPEFVEGERQKLRAGVAKNFRQKIYS